MKPFSLSVLLLLASLAARAEVVMVSGTVYDTGKGYYSQDPTVDYTADKSHCWAATSANLIQHWQDAYRDKLDMEGVPDGYAENAFTKPTGSRYLEVYNAISTNYTDIAGTLAMAVNWYFKGQSPTGIQSDHEPGGYGPSSISAMTKTVSTLSSLKSALDTAFKYSGYAAYVSITLPSGSGHAITCWGYETDSSGTLTALYISDSDDMKFGAQRLEVAQSGSSVSIYSPYSAYGYNKEGYKLAQISYLNSTASTYRDAKPSNTLTAVPGSGIVNTTADMTGRQIQSTSGLTVAEGGILAASGSNGTRFTLAGGGTAGDGLTVEAGSMVALQQAGISVSGYTGNGISAGSDVYLDNGSVYVCGNGGAGIQVRGTSDDPKVYMQLGHNTGVQISDNQKSGLVVWGGALPVPNGNGSYYSSTPQLDILQNEDVLIDNNHSDMGGGAFVYGELNVTYNTQATFSHNTAEKGGALAVQGAIVDTVLAKGTAELSHNTKLTISDNTATLGGGAFATALSMVDNTELTISGNKAGQGSAIYAGTQALESAKGGYYRVYAEVDIRENTTVAVADNINTGNSTSTIFFQGSQMSIADNASVTFSRNTNAADADTGYILHNGQQQFKVSSTGYMSAGDRVMEIAHNGEVTFSRNKAQYDIYNEGTLYLCADKDQTITFQHGFKNGDKIGYYNPNGGTTRIGVDAKGVASTGGTYRFKDGAASVEMKTAGANVDVNGGMVFTLAGAAGALAVSQTEFEDADFTLASASLELTDVVIAGDLSVDFGYFGQTNTLELTNVTFGTGSSLLLSMALDAEVSPLAYMALSGASSLTETTINLGDYLTMSGTTALPGSISLTVSGVLDDGSTLTIDTNGMVADNAVSVTDYTLDRAEDGKLYYSARQTPSSPATPEPTTATLSLLALAGLVSRRRRR